MTTYPRLVVHFRKPGQKTTRGELRLTYQLFENEFTFRWLALLNFTISRPHEIWKGGSFGGQVFWDLDELIQRMSVNLEIIGRHIALTGLPSPSKHLSARDLETLHSFFENHSRTTYKRLPSKTRAALRELNVLIHAQECFLEGRNSNYVNVVFRPSNLQPLRDSDYALFASDYKFGYLYLTYPMAGMPTLPAFLQQIEHEPRPQDRYGPDFLLSFGPDFELVDRSALDKWIIDKLGRDPRDPRLAVGHIPLGRLENPKVEPSELLREIAVRRYVAAVSLESSEGSP